MARRRRRSRSAGRGEPAPRLLLRAWILFLTILVLGHVALEAAGPRYEARANALTARTLDWALSALGVDSRMIGDTVTGSAASGEFALRIIRECTAESPLVLLLAAILAYPCGLREKAVGLAIGVPSILLLNVVRLASLFWVGIVRPDLFDAAHVLVWQSLMVLAVVGLWLLWVRQWVERHAPRPA